MALTTRFGIEIPDVGADADMWGNILNNYLNGLEALVFDKRGDIVNGNLTVTGSTSVTTLAASGALTLTGGTANGVAFLNGSKVLTTGSGLTYNGTRLTIGGVSAGASALLIPAGDITSDISSGSFAIGNYGDSSSELRLSTRGFTSFRTGATDGTNGAERMRLDSSGNLGLGVTPSAWGTSGSAYKAFQFGVSGALYGRTGNETAVLSSGVYFDNVGPKYMLSGNFASLYTQASGTHSWLTAPSGTAGAPISFTQAMTLTQGGNLLVGTTVDIAGVRLRVSGGSLVARGAGDVSSNSAIGEGALVSNTTGVNNTANGVNALLSNTTGVNNTANGVDALQQNTTGNENTANGVAALRNNTTGSANTANGVQALLSNTTGSANTANGFQALLSNTTGVNNTANGVNALLSNTTGIQNTANGVAALLSNTTGIQNTANGVNALRNNTTGVNNTANGVDALQQNTTGNENTANGRDALFSNTTGINNTANGVAALRNNTTGSANTANGVQALLSNTTGVNNTANGVNALLSNTTGIQNTANGVNALRNNTTGVNNTANGVDALQQNTTGNDNFAIGVNSGNDAVRTITTQSNEGVLGNNSTTAIFAKVAVTVTSDIRDKTEVAPVPLGLSFVNAVNPISYRFRKDRQSDVATGRTILGFSAQELLALQGNAQIIDGSDPENLKINSSDLIAVLFNALKELSIEVQTLKSKLGE